MPFMAQSDKIILGFNTGCLREEFRFPGAVKIIREIGCNAVEISLRIERFEGGWLDELKTEDLAGFQYVSLHAPVYDFGKDKKGFEILSRIEKFSAEIRRLDMVVFHPDPISDFSALEAFGLPVGVENMDQNKKTHRTIEDMERLLNEHPSFNMVLDVNHAFVNDNSYELGWAMAKRFKDRIKEVHLSGFKTLHDPVFETKQTELIRTISELDVPIIVESDISSETIQRERDYIIENIIQPRA